MVPEAKDFPATIFLGHKREPQFVEFPAHTTLHDALSASRTDRGGRAQIAEYRLVKVVEAKMVADIQCEVR